MVEQNLGDNLYVIGTKADFERLFRANYSVLCSFANSYLHDADNAEEVVQEVMFNLWTNREHLIFRTSVKGYLFRAVRNSSLNLIRHQQIKNEYAEHVQAGAELSLGSGDEEIIFSELENRIREAVDKLPTERKKVFILSRYEGLTYQEIGGRLGISVKTVENQMGKALKTLRIELAEYLPILIFLLSDLFKDQ